MVAYTCNQVKPHRSVHRQGFAKQIDPEAACRLTLAEVYVVSSLPVLLILREGRHRCGECSSYFAFWGETLYRTSQKLQPV